MYTAAIFHDIGYEKEENDRHALRSGKAFYEYAVAHQMDEEVRKQVERLIYAHSNKSLLKDKNTSLELVLLMEADLLDEEGAMGQGSSICNQLSPVKNKHPLCPAIGKIHIMGGNQQCFPFSRQFSRG